jgi:hypothetical protein
LKDVAFGEPIFALDIEGCQNLPMQDQVLEIRRVFTQRVDDGVAERVAALVPGALVQMVGRILDEARHHVFARRRDARVR